MQEQADERFTPEAERKKAHGTNGDTDDQLKPKYVADAVHIPLPGKLCAENACSRQAPENAQIENKDELVGDGHPRHLFRAKAADHQVIKHADKLRDAVLNHDRHSDCKHSAVKAFCSNQGA